MPRTAPVTSSTRWPTGASSRRVSPAKTWLPKISRTKSSAAAARASRVPCSCQFEPVGRRQQIVRHPVGDDALADQGSDNVRDGADHRGAPVAEHAVSPEEGKRDEEGPRQQVAVGVEGRGDHRADRVMAEVVNAGADGVQQRVLAGARPDLAHDHGTRTDAVF